MKRIDVKKKTWNKEQSITNEKNTTENGIHYIFTE